MQSIDEMETRHGRESRTRSLAVGFVAVFIVGVVVGRLTVGTSAAPSSEPTKATSVTATNAVPAATDTTAANPGPKDFYGVPWGTSERDARKLFLGQLKKSQRYAFEYYRGCYDDSMVSDRRCDYGPYYMAPDVPVMASLYFLKDSFQSVYLTWPHAGWEFVRTTFRNRFGSPTKTGVQTLQNAMGATFESKWEEWEWSDSSLKIWEYTTVDRSAARMELDTFARAAEATRAKQLKDAAAKF